MVLSLGCSSSKDPAPILPAGGDGDGGVGRTFAKLDADVEVGELDGRGDGNGSSLLDARDDSGGDSKDGPSLTPIITVTVEKESLIPPADGGVPSVLIVPASYGPKPVVTVVVVSQSGDPRTDDVSSVTASLNDPVADKPVASLRLAKSDSDTVPESDTTHFIFSGVPLDLSKLATGEYRLVFTATTVGGASASSTELSLWVDTGPTLVVNLPSEKGYYKGSAPVEVSAVQTKFAVNLVTMALGQGSPVPLTQTSKGVFKGNIDFNSFVPPLEGDQLATFRATNENGTQTVVLRHFVSDNVGPAIKDTAPVLGAMIGSVITIKATVDDPAGVDSSSVVAVVGNGDQNFEVKLVPLAVGGNVYSSLFDTTKLPSYALYPTISFRARDVLGNESTVSYMLSLDNMPPTIDLDPPNVRILKQENGKWVCSWSFDPVGPDAVDDGSLVTQLFDVRARIEDNGNAPLTGRPDFVLIGGVDPATVQVFILSNTVRPLVVDTSDPPNGYCDDINPELVPTSKPQTDMDAQVLDMVALSPGGAADFSPEPGVSCSASSGDPPGSYCPTTWNPSKTQWDDKGRAHSDTMTIAMSYSANLPSIYTLGPVVGDKLQCAGRQFDASNNLKNGWACLAVKAADKLGNVQVSRPIRVCVMATPSTTDCTEFKPLVRVIPSDPLEIRTSAPLLGPGGPLQAGDEVAVSGVLSLAEVNRVWKVDPLDTTGTRFALRDANGWAAHFCTCKDAACTEYDSCPKITITLQLTKGQPIVVETATPHGLPADFTGKVVISGNTEQVGVAGLPWTVRVVDATHFTLPEALATDPIKPGGQVVPVLVMPDCTGTVIKGGTDGGLPMVDTSKHCKPWQTAFPESDFLQ